MKVTEADKQRMREMKANGKSYEQIRRATGFSICTIRRWTNPAYREKANQNNLARYKKNWAEDPEFREQRRAYRNEYRYRTGL
ncbi:hypothetical protein [Rhizobium phage RHEph16]|uniref:Uncharacterized protein n=1 Tax=Rhizobium phage RHEph16 TaxID=2836132 RepID=A0AAE8AVF5_9CAUD|nr:hypothetical protein PP750_gp66 [Rhizobium phage RHEph16]QXV74375.1 hypothetical protein [Rhizobium phage RHEph16]